ncbi:MAG: dihydroorotase [Actinomycetota bacterium]|nr:MAG: dihydroorotase [Actinomycetota bacterium]
MSAPAWLLRGARVVDPAQGRDEPLDVLVRGGVVAEVGVGLDAAGATVLDVAGALLAPGLVDLHAHLREPGEEHKETIATGTRAAAAGGYTAVAAMANTSPVSDRAAVVRAVRELAEATGACDVFPVGAITKGQQGETLAEIGELVEAGVRLLSDDGRCVASARVLRNALTYARAFAEPVVIADHAEDPDLVEGGQMHEGVHSVALGLAGRPAEAEEVIVARDLAIARMTGGRLHLCHLSSARAVELVRRAKQEGIRVSAEVTPHHLTFTDEDLRDYDTNLKVNPPLRTAEDREALRDALVDGTIDAVATDHAPHAVEEKEVEFDRAPPGTIGLETALAVVLTELVAPGRIDLLRAIDALSTTPARILGASEHGGPIAPGRPANLVVVDPEASWVVEPPFVSKARNAAFLGRRLRGRVVHTLLRGRPTVLDGKVVA